MDFKLNLEVNCDMYNTNLISQPHFAVTELRRKHTCERHHCQWVILEPDFVLFS